MSRLLQVMAISLGLMLTATHASADWGSMLDDFSEAGKKMLGQETESNENVPNDSVISGLKEALALGSQRAIATAGQQNGFLNNPQIRIPLPPRLQQAGELMHRFGMGQMADDFEQSMNRAAEQAVPQAADIMTETIKTMSIADGREILNGDNDAATRYFENNTRDQLKTLFKPEIERSLQNVGATRRYTQLEKEVQGLPLMNEQINLDLTDYVTDQALDGLFTMIAEEERQIRENPAARTTELLRKVFSQ